MSKKPFFAFLPYIPKVKYTFFDGLFFTDLSDLESHETLYHEIDLWKSNIVIKKILLI